jgi:hypothetical protein
MFDNLFACYNVYLMGNLRTPCDMWLLLESFAGTAVAVAIVMMLLSMKKSLKPLDKL